MSNFLVVIAALVLDRCLGEPRRYHPLVGFGNLAGRLELLLRKVFLRSGKPERGYLVGLVALLIAVGPIAAVFWWLEAVVGRYPGLHLCLSAMVLYLAIGWKSLSEHADLVARPLLEEKVGEARDAVALIVSRDVSALDATAVASAATESVLENGADAVFSAIFWFLVAGLPGVVMYRLCNTLDAMWGYKHERYLRFGWAAARFDDLLNYIPARLTALSYALAGKTRLAFKCWWHQAPTWKSPNAGPVMASGAGALNVSLGGQACYHGILQQRPQLGPTLATGYSASADSIKMAIALVNRALILWLVAILITGLIQ